jgi:hypothetical protein
MLFGSHTENETKKKKRWKKLIVGLNNLLKPKSLDSLIAMCSGTIANLTAITPLLWKGHS